MWCGILDIVMHSNIINSLISILVDTLLVYSNIRISPMMVIITHIITYFQQEVNN